MAQNHIISKSRFLEFRRCPKLAWLHQHHPEVLEMSEDAVERMAIGREIGEIARSLFGEYVDVTAYKDGFPDRIAMERATALVIENKTPVICEAAFCYGGLYCAVDILKYDPEKDGWQIIEVKSSTKVKTATHIPDVAFQLYVLRKCGINVTGIYLALINRDYIFDGTLDKEKLFKIVDVTKKAEKAQHSVKSDLLLAIPIIISHDEARAYISNTCRYPSRCPCWNYCTQGIPEEELCEDYPECIDVDEIRSFLSQLHFPLMFLDFETVQPVIPRYIGTRPYDQVPFLFSLHSIATEGAPLKHTDFLAEVGTDPRRAVAERLVADIPSGACVTAYNRVFECTRLKELATQFPDLADRLLEIEDSIVDLMMPFQGKYYYLKAMRGSYSIKAVLPALFPNDPSLDYHNFDIIHNGSEAMKAFPDMENMPKKEQEKVRRALREYCKLDTYAMVKVWEKLREVAAAK